MARKISRGDLERVIAEENEAGRTPIEPDYAARLWSRLAGVDPDAVQVPIEDAIDARALEKAREVILRRYAGSTLGAFGIVTWLVQRRNELNGRRSEGDAP